MQRQYLEHGFGPFYRPDSCVLILGSFPSVKSREANFFYGISGTQSNRAL